jgi:hypothetical protein
VKVLLGYHSSFLTIAREIRKRHPDAELISLHPMFTKQLVDADIPAKSLGDYATDETREACFTAAVEIMSEANAFLKRREKIPLAPQVRARVMKHMPAHLYSKLPEMALLALVMDRACPDIAILHNDVEPATRLVALWCKSHNVPCIHVPHAVYLDHNDIDKVPGGDIHEIVTASHLAAAGPYQAAWYLARGMGQDKIRVTGLPQHDHWAALKPDRERALRLLKLNPEQPVVTYASSWSQSTNLLGCHGGVETCYQAFLEAARVIPEVQFIVKCHPNSNSSERHAEVADRLGVKCLVTDQHLPVILQATDLLISFGASNIILDAAHIPWVRLASTEGFREDPEVMGVAPNPPAFVQLITSALNRPPVDTGRLRAKYLGYDDGRAYSRIVDFAEELTAWPEQSSSGQK